MRVAPFTAVAALGAVALACSSPTTPSTDTTAGASSTSTSATLPAVYQKFGTSVTVRLDGTNVVLSSNGVPDHPSPYFGSGDPRYEAPQAGMVVNPNLIATQSFVIRVPVSPASTTASDTPLGAIGMATNGVAFFNQYAAGRQPLTFEILSFDRYDGHPQNTGVYHYHMEPFWLTTKGGRTAFLGVLLDGFPVYGPDETSGAAPGGLDACNGHTHATTDSPQGIYHYHVTTATPYISGCYRGTPGSVG
jgi:hypothetical protein